MRILFKWVLVAIGVLVFLSIMRTFNQFRQSESVIIIQSGVSNEK